VEIYEELLVALENSGNHARTDTSGHLRAYVKFSVECCNAAERVKQLNITKDKYINTKAHRDKVGYFNP
jgi:hypothetical protein